MYSASDLSWLHWVRAGDRITRQTDLITSSACCMYAASVLSSHHLSLLYEYSMYSASVLSSHHLSLLYEHVLSFCSLFLSPQLVVRACTQLLFYLLITLGRCFHLPALHCYVHASLTTFYKSLPVNLILEASTCKLHFLSPITFWPILNNINLLCWYSLSRNC